MAALHCVFLNMLKYACVFTATHPNVNGLTCISNELHF